MLNAIIDWIRRPTIDWILHPTSELADFEEEYWAYRTFIEGITDHLQGGNFFLI